MKILVYGINYSPELTGIGKYTGEMCEWLASKGHKVEVITAMPYYPEWQIHAKYRRKGWHSEVLNGVKVYRCPFYVPKNINSKGRILNELSFILSSSFYWTPFIFKKYDVVLAVCPPMQTGLFPILYSLLRRKPFVYHVQDLQVDAARELKLIQNQFVLRTLEKAERFIMRKATLVSVISEGMKQRVISKGVKENKIFLLPNWTDVQFIRPLSKSESLRSDFNFSNEDKVVLYSGNMGEKQGLDMVLNVAERLKDRTNWYFVFSGEGAAKTKLQSLSKEKGLKNVLFVGLQPYEKLGRLLSMADLHLVIQKKAAADLVFPSKLMSILSAGGLAVVTADLGSGLYQFITSRNIAVPIQAENADELYESIVKNLEADNQVVKTNARKFAEAELSSEKIFSDLERTLKGLRS